MNYRRIAFLCSAALLACAAFLPPHAFAQGKIKASLVTPPVTFDAGSDPLATGANTHPSFPRCSSAAEPIHGLCVGDTTAGSSCRRAGDACGAPGDNGVCVAYANDGVTAADVAPSKRILDKRSECSLRGTTLSFRVAFEGDGDKGRDFSAIDTDGNESGGTCSNNATIACGSDRDCLRARACVGGANDLPCDDDGDCFGGTCSGDLPDVNQPGGHCLSGDEYWMQALVYVGSNVDDGDGGDHQACTPNCLASANGVCQLGVCQGGSRDGLACSGKQYAFGGTCPDGGDCLVGPYNGNDTTPADSDEVVLNVAPQYDLTAKIHCPFVLGLSVPFEVSRGKGKGKVDLALLDAFVPPNVRVSLQGCFVHDQAGSQNPARGGELVHALGFGVLEPGTTPDSANHVPCADKTVIIHDDVTQNFFDYGNSIALFTPASPILGTIGLTTAKLRCSDDGDCRQRCCGGTCVDSPLCPGD